MGHTVHSIAFAGENVPMPHVRHWLVAESKNWPGWQPV